MAVGLGVTIWPSIVSHGNEPALSGPTSRSLLAGLGALAALGVRYPVKMLPLLMFELLWKAIFLISFALPLWMAGKIDPDSLDNIQACLMVVILLPILPWRHLVSTYLTAPSERWT
jgi:hypothetical protein